MRRSSTEQAEERRQNGAPVAQVRDVLQTDVSRGCEALGGGLTNSMRAAREEVHSERRRPAGGRRDRCSAGERGGGGRSQRASKDEARDTYQPERASRKDKGPPLQGDRPTKPTVHPSNRPKPFRKDCPKRDQDCPWRVAGPLIPHAAQACRLSARRSASSRR